MILPEFGYRRQCAWSYEETRVYVDADGQCMEFFRAYRECKGKWVRTSLQSNLIMTGVVSHVARFKL